MKLFRITLICAATIFMLGCTKETMDVSPVSSELDGAEVTATAIAHGAFVATKADYTDSYSDVESITDIVAGAWKSGDSFVALEINGSTVTAVTFTTTGTGKSAEFKAAGAEEPDDNTQWVAVNGKAKVENDMIVCTYDGQDGTIGNVGNYDYVVAKAQGKAPVFDFSSRESKPLTFLMRLLLPAGIKDIEFNTGKEHNGGWDVSSAGKAMGTVSSTEKEAVKMLSMPAVSTAKQIAYLAVPAIDLMNSSDNRVAGLIVTILSADKRKSQGKVTSMNLAPKGGHAGTFDMSDLELMARPLASEAIKLGTVSYNGKDYPLGSWAPFNVGGDVPTSDEAIAGNLYSWGETEPKVSFSKNNYRWFNGSSYNTQLGYKYIGAAEGVPPFIEYWAAGGKGGQHGPGTYYDIGGTKFDVARVKWGSEWRMPSNEVSTNILKDGTNLLLTNEIDTENKVIIDEYDPGAYTNSSNYTSTKYGAVTIKANGAELSLYRCSYTDNGSFTNSGTKSRYWTSTTDYGNIIYDPNSGNYWNRGCQMRIDAGENYMNNKSWIWDGLRVRAVLNE